VTAVEFTTRLITHALAELAERVERMPDSDLVAALDGVAASGRSSAGDLVAGILEAEHRRRWREARA
jgi:hypothetical protein